MKTKLIFTTILITGLLFCFSPLAFAYLTEYQLDQFAIDNGTSSDIDYFNSTADYNDFSTISSTTADDISGGVWHLQIEDAILDSGNTAINLGYTPITFQNGDSGYVEVWYKKPSIPMEGNEMIGLKLGDDSSETYEDRAEMNLLYYNNQFYIALIDENTVDFSTVVDYTTINWSDISDTTGIRFRLEVDSATKTVTGSYDIGAGWQTFSNTTTFEHYSSGDVYDGMTYVHFNPEPSTILMFLLGIGGVFVMRRRIWGV